MNAYQIPALNQSFQKILKLVLLVPFFVSFLGKQKRKKLIWSRRVLATLNPLHGRPGWEAVSFFLTFALMQKLQKIKAKRCFHTHAGTRPVVLPTHAKVHQIRVGKVFNWVLIPVTIKWLVAEGVEKSKIEE